MRASRGRLSLTHVIVAAVASGWTYLAIRQPAWAALVCAIAAVPFSIWFLVSLAVSMLDRLQCPACGERALRRRSVNPFGFRYFECTVCGTRCKRRSLGTWYDASGRRDAVVFAGQSRHDPWGGGPVAPESDTATGTHATLLRNKRHRAPASDDPGDT